MTQAFPLTWPNHVLRREPYLRRKAKFSGRGKPLTVADAIRRLQDEADKLGATYTVLSSNVELRLDGLPRSGQRDPDDPGVAFWFQLSGKPICLPCDTFTRVADNIAAIAAHIEATRAIERYGVATASQMFEGFMALPAPSSKRDWRDVLGLNADERSRVNRTIIEGRYRKLAAERHPDRAGGSNAAMAELNIARDEALREVGT